jgi:hypothetical protein
VAAEDTTAQRTDPQAGSPAGVMYQIPLDTGRRDAAPVLPVGRQHASSSGGSPGATGGPGGGPPGGSGTGAGGSGSGSGGQGASGSGNGAGASAAERSPGGGTPSDPSSIHSENGFGSSSQVPGVSPAAVRTGAGVAAAHTAGSTLPSYLLMGLIGVAAVAVGLMASRATRHPGGPHPGGPQPEGSPPTGV